jgi:hypothetical protein
MVVAERPLRGHFECLLYTIFAQCGNYAGGVGCCTCVVAGYAGVGVHRTVAERAPRRGTWAGEPLRMSGTGPECQRGV